jgi:hypothetical protein
MKKFLSRVDLKIEFLKNYLLQLSIPKKILLCVIVTFVVIFICAKQYINKADIKNIFNSQTVISAINTGNTSNEIIFESNDKKVEVENNVNGQGESFVIIKDVGTRWKQKNLQAKVIGNGELEIKLSGIQSIVPPEPVIFVQYQNFKINGQEVFGGIKEGRTDKDELIFKVLIKDGQTLEMSIEYKNALNIFNLLYAALLYDASTLTLRNFWLIFMFLLLGFCAYVFNKENQARVICKIWTWILIIGGIYFLLLNSTFFKTVDDNWVIFGSADNTAFNVLSRFFSEYTTDIGGRFTPFGFVNYEILVFFIPHGLLPNAFYFFNALLFTSFILIMTQIFDFKSKQKTIHLYIKLFFIISLPFLANQLFRVFTTIPYQELEVVLMVAIFLFAYKKAVRGGGGWFVIALLCAIFATYCKEAVFVIFLTIALTNFLFNRNFLKLEDKLFNISLILNAVVFILLYYFLSVANTNVFYENVGYNKFFTISLAERFFPFIQSPILILMVIFVFVRAYIILFRKDNHHIFYDGILFACFGYLLAFEVLGLFSALYFTTVIVLFSPIMVYWVLILWDNKKYMSIFLICIFIIFSSYCGVQLVKYNFLRYYTSGSINVYNTIKIDAMTKYNHQISLYDESGLYGFASYVTHLIQYVDRKDLFDVKLLDSTEIHNVNADTPIREKEHRPVDEGTIFISTTPNLPTNNPEFKDFIIFSKIIYQRHYLATYGYSYIHKDRL